MINMFLLPLKQHFNLHYVWNDGKKKDISELMFNPGLINLGCLIGRVPWFINPGLTLDGGL